MTDERALSFGRAASDYEAARPGYPREAVDWAVPADARTIIDAGAGTGKLTRSLLGRAADVIAVEPDAVMRATLSRAVTGVQVLDGRAEALPMPDAWADAVVFGQAWHWVRVPDASREVARVLRPGGTLGLLWNFRDERVPWVAALTRIMHRSGGEAALDDGGPSVGDPFGPLETSTFTWTETCTPARLLRLAASRSYVITAPEGERERIFGAITALTRDDPALAGRSEFALPYVTHAFRARRP